MGKRQQQDVNSYPFDPRFERQIQRLHSLTVWGRWLVIVGCWVAIAPWVLWSLREEIALMRSHFTFAALRYAFIFNPLPALGLTFCIGLTTGVLLWQSQNILFGMSPRYKRRLAKRVQRIRAAGSTHPLWKWVIGSE